VGRNVSKCGRYNAVHLCLGSGNAKQVLFIPRWEPHIQTSRKPTPLGWQEVVFCSSNDVAETGLPGFEAETWYGLLAPAKTPLDIIDRLNRSAAKAVQADAFKKLSVNEGLVLIAAPPQEFGRYYRSEMERWRKVIEDAGIKVD